MNRCIFAMAMHRRPQASSCCRRDANTSMALGFSMVFLLMRFHDTHSRMPQRCSLSGIAVCITGIIRTRDHANWIACRMINPATTPLSTQKKPIQTAGGSSPGLLWQVSTAISCHQELLQNLASLSSRRKNLQSNHSH